MVHYWYHFVFFRSLKITKTDIIFYSPVNCYYIYGIINKSIKYRYTIIMYQYTYIDHCIKKYIFNLFSFNIIIVLAREGIGEILSRSLVLVLIIGARRIFLHDGPYNGPFNVSPKSI